MEVLSFDMVYDAGNSMNPSVDIGQIEGCIVQAQSIAHLAEMECSTMPKSLKRVLLLTFSSKFPSDAFRVKAFSQRRAEYPRAARLQNEIAPEKALIDTKNGLKNAKKDPKSDPKHVRKVFSPFSAA